MTISRSAFLAGTASAASAALFMRGNAFAADATPVTLGMIPTSDLLPAVVARDEGFFTKHNLNATIQIIPIAPTIIGALRGGSIAFGALTVPAFLLANEGGLDLVAVSGAARETRKTPRTSLVARTGSNIHKPADLVGKHVGVPGIGAVLDVMLRYWLVQNKVDVKSVNIVEAPFAQAPDMLKSGSIDALATADPFRALILKQGIGYKVSDYWSDLRDNSLGLFWASTREFASKNPAVLSAFKASLADGVAYAEANPDKAKADALDEFKVPSSIIKYDLSLEPADFTYFAGVLQPLGMLHGPVDAAKDIA